VRIGFVFESDKHCIFPATVAMYQKAGPHGAPRAPWDILFKHEVILLKNEVILSTNEVILFKHEVILFKHEVILFKHEVILSKHEVILYNMAPRWRHRAGRRAILVARQLELKTPTLLYALV